MPTGTISGTASQALLDFLLRKRNPVAPLDPRTGRHLLPFGRACRATAAVLAAQAAAFVALSIYAFRDDPGSAGLVLSLSIFGLLLLATLYGLYDTFVVTISFSEEMLVRENRGGRPVWMPWSSVTSVEYSSIANCFVFQSPGRPSIRVSIYRSGLRTLAETAGRGLDGNPAGGAIYLLHEKARNPG